MKTLTQHARRIRKLSGSDAKWRAVHEAYASDDEIMESHKRRVLYVVDTLRAAFLESIEATIEDLNALENSGTSTFPTAGGLYETGIETILRRIES